MAYYLPGKATSPTGYQLLSYIQSTGAQCIITSVGGETATQEWEFDVEYVTPQSNTQLVSVGVGDPIRDGLCGALYNNTWTVKESVNGSVTFTGRQTVKVTIQSNVTGSGYSGSCTTTVSVGGTTSATHTRSWAQERVWRVPTLLFAGYKGDGTDEKCAFSTVRLYKATCKRDGILAHDFKPVINLSTTKVGLYDNVTKGFYGNSESGADFTPGDFINATQIYMINPTTRKEFGKNIFNPGQARVTNFAEWNTKKDDGVQLINGYVYKKWTVGQNLSQWPQCFYDDDGMHEKMISIPVKSGDVIYMRYYRDPNSWATQFSPTFRYAGTVNNVISVVNLAYSLTYDYATQTYNFSYTVPVGMTHFFIVLGASNLVDYWGIFSPGNLPLLISVNTPPEPTYYPYDPGRTYTKFYYVKKE